MPASEKAADQSRVEAAVGHPEDRFEALKERIQADVVKSFAEVEREFLQLIWCMDAYRIAQVVPRGMGKDGATPASKLQGIYRGKGNYFSSVAAHILGQMTTSTLASRSNVMGFSQTHQIDIAWPARDQRPLRDPLICCEAKLTGAPANPDNKARGAADDWSNRRKELKFQATDLKLYRQAAGTEIHHWDHWRRKAPPAVYSLWAARLEPDDNIEYMIEEARVLTETYSDGVGIYAFRENSAGTGYEPVPPPRAVAGRVTGIDRILGLIAADIRSIMAQHGNRVPPPVQPPTEPGASAN